MKIRIIKIGKPAMVESKSWVHQYATRLNKINRLECLEFKDLKALKTFENKILGAGQLIVALDENGKQWASLEFSKKLQSWLNDPAIKSVSFVIGGPYGLDEAFKNRAHIILSLAKATIPSDLAWVMLSEQLYRAFTILKGMPYHHG
jgi:23S rRNA (pseudouridine1915-N3)-methyltransferase